MGAWTRVAREGRSRGEDLKDGLQLVTTCIKL